MRTGEEILQSLDACVRAVFALKAGRASKEGIEFLSVGIDDTVDCIKDALKHTARQAPKPLWLIGDYGEGKSHTMRLFASIAQREQYVWVYVTHDAREQIGLHKPARLFRRILWEIRWSYPHINLSGYEWKMSCLPNYDDERFYREYLPEALSRLGKSLSTQGYHGIVVFIDEVEDCCTLWWNQHRPAYETLHSFVHSSEPYLVVCLGMTPSGLESLKSLWGMYVGRQERELLQHAIKRAIPLPHYDASYLPVIAERILTVHSVAFDWQPTIGVEEILRKIKERQGQSKHWRTVVQSIVTELEIAHQATHRYINESPEIRREVPKVTRPLSKSVIERSSIPKLKVGDRVEFTAGNFRGWKGTVRKVSENHVEIEILLRNQMRMIQSVPPHMLKRVRE